MELIVLNSGEERRVSIRRSGDIYELTVDETPYRVEAVRATGSGLRSLLLDGVQHEVVVERRGEGDYWVSTRGGGEAVAVTDPLTHLAEERHGATGGSHQVKAYMPGRVVAVLAPEGTEVEAGQGIVVLEAMKMENEIQAESAGVVRRLFVEPGQAVEGGDPLFEIE